MGAAPAAAPNGPGVPFDVLWEPPAPGPGLPRSFRSVYGGDWVLPPIGGELPYRYANFVMSHDGRVSFNVPGHEGGGDVSGFDPHDQWLMGLLRARADAVTVGANTLRVEPDHLWTAGFIAPYDAEAFADLRVAEGRAPHPLQVFLTRSGDLPRDAAVFADTNLQVVVATTRDGRRALASRLGSDHTVEVLVAGDDDLDLASVHRMLRRDHGVRTVLCEGGPRVYGAMLAAGQIDEEFLTWSPVLIGDTDTGPSRPGLVEGVPFPPGGSASRQLRSIRRAGNHLFVRSAYPGT